VVNELLLCTYVRTHKLVRITATRLFPLQQGLLNEMRRQGLDVARSAAPVARLRHVGRFHVQVRRGKALPVAEVGRCLVARPLPVLGTDGVGVLQGFTKLARKQIWTKRFGSKRSKLSRPWA